MKKVIIFLFIVTIIGLLISNKQEKITIPLDAIRFRIIANSSNFKNQEEKIEIKKDLEPILESILSKSTSIEETRTLVKENMKDIEKIISQKEENYSINFGKNYFPEKVYYDVTYPAGEYESLVITLGDGLGENWWCVLFPPLCLLEAEEKNIDKVEYKLFAKEIIEKFR